MFVHNFSKWPLIALLLVFGLSGCERPDPQVTIVAPPPPGQQAGLAPTPIATAHPLEAGREPLLEPKQETAVQSKDTSLPTYQGTPTPDPPHASGNGQTASQHFVNPGETLGYIAQLYGTTLEALMTANGLAAADFLAVGQALTIPNTAAQTGPAFKIIPDSELVYGPAAKDFRVQDFAALFNGYLMGYREEVEGVSLSGPEIVALVANRYSVNPRLLLAVLEHRAGWVTQGGALDDGFPMGRVDALLPGLSGS